MNSSLLKPAILSHLLCAEVGMAASSIPVPWDRLGVKGHHNTKIFTDSVKDEASNPQVVSHVDTFARPNLELPLKHNKEGIVNSYTNNYRFLHTAFVMMENYLCRHDFSITSIDLNPSIQTSSIVRLHYVSSVRLICPDSTVIRPWLSGKRLNINTQLGLLMYYNSTKWAKLEADIHLVDRGSRWKANQRDVHLCPG